METLAGNGGEQSCEGHKSHLSWSGQLITHSLSLGVDVFLTFSNELSPQLCLRWFGYHSLLNGPVAVCPLALWGLTPLPLGRGIRKLTIRQHSQWVFPGVSEFKEVGACSLDLVVDLQSSWELTLDGYFFFSFGREEMLRGVGSRNDVLLCCGRSQWNMLVPCWIMWYSCDSHVITRNSYSMVSCIERRWWSGDGFIHSTASCFSQDS